MRSFEKQSTLGHFLLIDTQIFHNSLDISCVSILMSLNEFHNDFGMTTIKAFESNIT